MSNYNFKQIEEKWQDKWEKDGVYKDYSKKEKFYVLDMFPYPSGAGLHVGHPKGYIATDVFARFKMLKGCSVIHPMGWDAFGLPAENYAIKNKVHPKIAVEKNIETFKAQLKKFGFTYDWDREINTTDPEYYKWTQWIFLQMFKKGLAYESNEPVNWCPSCKTVLANEDLDNGRCERCDSAVEQKKLRQWVLKMTDYADRLLYDLDSDDLDWEDMIKEQQRNWIGRSEGAEIEFSILNSKFSIKVYTTRVDTIFGCTYCVVAPEHSVIESLKSQIANYKEVKKYIEAANRKTELERTELQKEKTGIELKGIKVVNPFNNEEIPLFVADYVLGHYGTGAVMAVPAHDERDFEFARKNNITIKHVIEPIYSELRDSDVQMSMAILNKGNYGESLKETLRYQYSIIKEGELTNIFCYTGDGILVNSKEYDGLTSKEAREKMTKWLEEKKIGKKKINYKMRDWVFSRQRYWGEPIPIIHCEKCGAQGVNEKDLPIRLPEVEKYEPTGTGEGPLAGIEEWVNTECPKCGGKAKRETNTMPQWAGSSWYYLRYIDPKNNEKLIDKKLEKEWMPVDLYVGGAEHATRHLLYARFWHKFLFDIGAVSTTEPFKKLIYVGLINAEDGRKMSKRWNNVVNPDDVIKQYGADSLRLYEMFMGPFMQNISWSTDGVKGVYRFLEKVWNYVILWKISENENQEYDNIDKILNKTIKKVSDDIASFNFNTAISSMMIFVNEKLSSSLKDNVSNSFVANKIVKRDDLEKFLIILSPFAPHITEELWERLGNKESIFKASWPEPDLNLIKDETINLVLQVNGKLRDTIEVEIDIAEEKAIALALDNEKIKNWIEGKEIIKKIFVKNRLINIVIK